MRMEIHTIETVEGFLSLRDEWNSLLQSSAADCVFLTHEWLSVWWKHMSEDRALHIVTVREDGELTGILPLAERAPRLSRMMPRTLEFLGTGLIGSDYLDAIVRPGREPKVLATLADHLDNCGLMLQLNQLRGGACVASVLAEKLRHREWIGDETKMNVCPYIDLRGHTWDSYLATLGPNIRKNINRYLRNLPKTFHMQFDCATTPVEARAALESAIDLHHKRWGARGTSEAFQTVAVIAFHREFVQRAAERGWLRLLVLSLDGKAVAALYGLRYGPTFYFYQSGFDPAYSKHSVGVTTMGLGIKTAIEEGALEYDFLHGDEEYKFHWASGSRDLHRLELHPPQVSAWIYKHAIDVNRSVRQMAKRLLNRSA
jgi:CelD/BcsL family acetyltransferase involved in cellulose biosynthesis